MPYKESQPTLMGFLGIPVVTKVAKTRLLGGPYIHFGGFLMVCSYLYESGAILGRAKCDKLTELAKMFSMPRTEEENMNSLQDMARERLEKYKKEFKKQPESFYDLFFVLELKLLGLSIGDTDLKTLKKALGEECLLKQFEDHIKMSGLEGIGFGSRFPELTERLYRNYHESINMDVWSKWAARLAIREKPTIISLEEQEETVLQMVAAYVSEYYPELLDPLDLRGHLEG